jgi:pyroglutamyl-peptidase
MPPLRLLLTGFGPFPGTPDNPSAWLVERLASAAPQAGLGATLHAEVLPSEWDAVASLAPRLFDAIRPGLILNFGLSRRARGFRIERFAHNRVMARPDAVGALPTTGSVRARGPDRLQSGFPAARLASHLKQQGLEAAASRSAGRYLCNFLYYLSLEWARRQETPCLAAFVHMPPTKADGGTFTEAELLRGAEAILRFGLALASEDNARRPVAARRGTALAGGSGPVSS